MFFKFCLVCQCIDIFGCFHEGEDLSDLAVEYSICPSKGEGGMLGWVRKGQMVCLALRNIFRKLIVIDMSFRNFYFHWCLCLKNLDGFTIQDGMNAIQSMLFNSHNENRFDAVNSD